MKKLLGCLLLVMHAVVTAAASSTNVVERARVDSSDGEQVIEISPISSPTVPPLVLKSSGGSRTRGSRVNLAAFNEELNRVGLTSEHIDGAQDVIRQQLSLLASTTPRSTRSERTIDQVRQRIDGAVQRKKAALSESTGTKISASNSLRSDSDEDLSSAMDHHDDDNGSEAATLKNMLVFMREANLLLTENNVLTQESLDKAEEEATTNQKQYRVGLVVGIVGTALAVIFGGVAFIPPFVA